MKHGITWSFSRKMGEIETVEAEKIGWLDLPRGTSYPTFPYLPTTLVKIKIIDQTEMTSKVGFNQAMKRVMPYTYLYWSLLLK